MKEIMNNKYSRKNDGIMLVLLFCSLIVFDPTSAHAAGNPIVSAMEWVGDLLTSGLARSAAIVAVAILGYLAWFGHITAERAIRFILGIVFVFGGAALVDLIKGAVG